MLRKAAIALSVVVLFGSVASAAEKKKLAVGDSAPEFKSLDATSGKKVSLDSYKQDVLVVAITCNHCPVAVAYEDRMIDFVKKHGGEKVALVAINVNNTEADKLPAMKERAKEKGFNFDYAYDPSQEIGKALGARVTPEFFVFDKNRKLVYTGAFDDSMDPGEVKNNYVEKAVLAVLEGTEVPKSTKAKGCGVRYDN